MRRSAIRVLGTCAIVFVSVRSPVLAFGQEPATRAEADRQQREAKEKNERPYEENGLEKGMHFFEDRAIFILDREGFYPKLGSLAIGSGFAAGVGFRDRDLFHHYGSLDVWAAGSIKRYSAYRATFSFPELARKKLLLETWGGRKNFIQENYFGIGPDSDRDDQSDYAIRTSYVGGRAGVRPLPAVLLGGGLEFQQPRIGQGQNDRIPNTGEIFMPADVPGSESRSDFLRSSGFVEIDYRKPLYARKGGWYRVDVAHYDDRTANLYSFTRYDVDLRQFVSVLAERRVFAARFALSTSDTPSGQTLPFFYMPTLGGNDTLRGFREYRFRGPHAILGQAEYRWEIWSGFDGALFYDAGKVENRRADLNFKDLEHDYGVGFRFNTNNGIVLRVDAAFGSADGKHLYIVFGGIF